MSYLSEAMFSGNRELSETEVNDGKINFTFETKDGETYDIKASNSDDAITNFHKAYPTVQDDDIIALYDESDIHYCPVSGEELDEQKLNELFNANISPNFSPNINLDLSGGGAASLLGLLGESSEHGFSVGDKVYYVDDEPKVPGEIVEIYDDGTCLVVVNGDPDDQVVVSMDSIDYWDDSLGECTMTEDTIRKSNGKWTNRGDDGKEHGEFDTKAEADAQRKAMYANGYKGESKKAVREWYVGEPSDYAANGRSYYSNPKGWKEKLATVEDLVNSNPDIYISGSTSWKACVSDIYGNPLYQFDFWEDKKSFEDQLKEFSAISKSVNLYKLNRDKLKKRVKEDFIPDPKDTYIYSTIIIDPVDEGEHELVKRDGMKCQVTDRLDDEVWECKFEDGYVSEVFADELVPVTTEGKKLCEYEDDPYENYDDDTNYIDYDEAEFARDDLGFDKEDIGKYTWGNVRSKYESKKRVTEAIDFNSQDFSIPGYEYQVGKFWEPSDYEGSSYEVTYSQNGKDVLSVAFWSGLEDTPNGEGVVVIDNNTGKSLAREYDRYSDFLDDIINGEDDSGEDSEDEWMSYGDGYDVIRKSRHEFIVLYGRSQIGSADSLEKAEKIIEADKEKRGIKKKELQSWRLIKELNPDSTRDVNEAEKNGFYLTKYRPVYKYADEHGFLHYTDRVIESKKKMNEDRKRFERPDSHMDMVKSSPIYDFVVPALRRMFDDLEVDSSIITQFGPWQELVDAAAELVLRYDEYMADNYDDSVVSESKSRKKVKEKVTFDPENAHYRDDLLRYFDESGGWPYGHKDKVELAVEYYNMTPEQAEDVVKEWEQGRGRFTTEYGASATEINYFNEAYNDSYNYLLFCLAEAYYLDPSVQKYIDNNFGNDEIEDAARAAADEADNGSGEMSNGQHWVDYLVDAAIVSDPSDIGEGREFISQLVKHAEESGNKISAQKLQSMLEDARQQEGEDVITESKKRVKESHAPLSYYPSIDEMVEYLRSISSTDKYYITVYLPDGAHRYKDYYTLDEVKKCIEDNYDGEAVWTDVTGIRFTKDAPVYKGFVISSAETANGSPLKRGKTSESKKKVKESTDDGIRIRQLRNNIEEICDEYLNGIYDGYNEPFSSTDELVDYVYSQVFDLKSSGGGYTRYGTGICRDLKYLGKDFIVNEIIKYGQDILAEDVVTTTSI